MGCKGSGEKKHRHKVACASAHHKQMEDLMGTEVFMFCIKDRHFQCVDDATDGIDNASCQQPSECRFGQCVKDLGECQHTQPSHADVDHRRKPLRAGDPAGFHDDSNQCHAPYQDT